MNVLLDACALIALTHGELSAEAAFALQSAPEANVSVVSPWEIAIKAAGGKLRLEDSPAEWYRRLADRHGLRAIPLDDGTAFAAAAQPPIHRDPFDRVLVALALAHDLTVLTSDENIRKYPGVRTLW